MFLFKRLFGKRDKPVSEPKAAPSARLPDELRAKLASATTQHDRVAVWSELVRPGPPEPRPPALTTPLAGNEVLIEEPPSDSGASNEVALSIDGDYFSSDDDDHFEAPSDSDQVPDLYASDKHSLYENRPDFPDDSASDFLSDANSDNGASDNGASDNAPSDAHSEIRSDDVRSDDDDDDDDVDDDDDDLSEDELETQKKAQTVSLETSPEYVIANYFGLASPESSTTSIASSLKPAESGRARGGKARSPSAGDASGDPLPDTDSTAEVVDLSHTKPGDAGAGSDTEVGSVQAPLASDRSEEAPESDSELETSSDVEIVETSPAKTGAPHASVRFAEESPEVYEDPSDGRSYLSEEDDNEEDEAEAGEAFRAGAGSQCSSDEEPEVGFTRPPHFAQIVKSIEWNSRRSEPGRHTGFGLGRHPHHRHRKHYRYSHDTGLLLELREEGRHKRFRWSDDDSVEDDAVGKRFKPTPWGSL